MQIKDYLNKLLAVIAESPFVEAQKLSFEAILKEISELLQDVPDLQAIKDRINEPVENYEAYSRKRKTHLNRD